MRKEHWLIILVVVLLLNFAALIFFGMIHVELWDYSMNSILISRDEFAMMNRRGVLLFLISISSSAVLVKTITVYRIQK
jgi:hypothetical protein